jgi:hypothetical protein
MSALYKWIQVSVLMVFLGAVNMANACTPYGLIGIKWNQLKTILGNCVNDEGPDDAGGRIQSFEKGWVSWDGHSNAAFAVYGLIGKKWMILGGPKGFGHPINDETDSGPQLGRYNLFERGGSIIWKRNTNEAFSVYGDIRKIYEYEGFEFGPLGFPTSDEKNSGTSGDRIGYFENGSILWNKSHADTIVRINGTRLTYRINHISFAGGDPVGGKQVELTIRSNGAYKFQGGFHSAATVLNPISEKTSFLLIIRGFTGKPYTFSQSGSVSAYDRNFDWYITGNSPEIASGWSDIEQDGSYYWNASTRLDLAKLWADIKAGAGYVGDAVAIVGPYL